MIPKRDEQNGFGFHIVIVKKKYRCGMCKELKNIKRKGIYCKECLSVYESAIYYDMKNQIFTFYDNKCFECEEKDIDRLELDHINNDGYLDRKKAKNGIALFRSIVKEDRWDQFQLLCGSCHLKKTKDYTRYLKRQKELKELNDA